VKKEGSAGGKSFRKPRKKKKKKTTEDRKDRKDRKEDVFRTPMLNLTSLLQEHVSISDA